MIREQVDELYSLQSMTDEWIDEWRMSMLPLCARSMSGCLALEHV